MVWTLCLVGLMGMGLVEPEVGLDVKESVTFRPGTYYLSRPTSSDLPVMTISGNNIVVDFSGVVLRGSKETIEPDQREGIAVVVTGKNVTLKGLSAHGYRHGVIGKGASKLNVLDCDFSYNWKQRLKSGLDKEDTSDWMSYHQNEENEWLRWGTGLYLDDCDGFEVKNLVVRGGQNGLLITQSEGGRVWNSDLSFLSAVGLGLYRSSDNVFMHNNIDWCVRGYSHGVYNRGQDSSGILIYEQSHRNVFAYNSVTHGGDGFFLWAGQTTMDSGEGGCNDNVVFGNDFSHAPTNGIETTFSRNTYANNLVLECWHGVWGGYSYETKFVGNVFGLNAEGMAIEHGQDNVIEGNIFRRENDALRIWSNVSQDPNWGYPKHRDTRSRDLLVKRNIFFDTVNTVFNISRTTRVDITDNFIKNNGQIFKIGDGVRSVNSERNEFWLASNQNESAEGVFSDKNVIERRDNAIPKPATMLPSGNVILGLDTETQDYLRRFESIEWTGIAPLKGVRKSWEAMTPEEMRQAVAAPYMVRTLAGGKNPFLKPGTLRGRRFILVDQWGPYDFQSPILWPRVDKTLPANTRRFEILGPVGKWKLKKSSANVKLNALAGNVPGFLDIELVGEAGNMDIELEYVGVETRDYRGVKTAAGTPVEFGWSEFRVPISWEMKFWNFDAQTQDPRTQAESFKKLFAGGPVAVVKDSELNRSWGGSPAPGVNSDYFATVATGEFAIEPGEYVLDVTSDDGVRVYLDGKVIFEDWTYHAPQSESIVVKLGGSHRLKVEHFELNGYSTLQVKLRKP